MSDITMVLSTEPDRKRWLSGIHAQQDTASRWWLQQEQQKGLGVVWWAHVAPARGAARLTHPVAAAKGITAATVHARSCDLTHRCACPPAPLHIAPAHSREGLQQPPAAASNLPQPHDLVAHGEQQRVIRAPRHKRHGLLVPPQRALGVQHGE